MEQGKKLSAKWISSLRARYSRAIWSRRMIAFMSSCRCASVLKAVRLLNPNSHFGVYFHEIFDPNLTREFNERAITGIRYQDGVGSFGECYRLNVNDHISWNVYVRGYYDLVPLALGLFFGRAFKGATVIDVGANIGSTSIALAKKGIDVLGIEASSRTASELSHNVSLNSPLPYTVANVAVVSQETRDKCSLYLSLYVPLGNTGSASLNEHWASKTATRAIELVRAYTIDDLIALYGITSVAFVKLDIEGSEYDALRGAEKLLTSRSPPLSFEWYPDGAEESDVRSLLPTGYRFFSTSGRRTEKGIVLSLETFDPTKICYNVLALSEVDIASNPAVNAMVAEMGVVVDFDEVR